MKIIIALILTIFVESGICFADTVSLSKDQFQNIDEIDKTLKAKYAQYKGINGSQEKMEIFGISAETFQKEVTKLDFATLNSEKINKRTQLINKIKALGFTDEEATLLLGGN